MRRRVFLFLFFFVFQGHAFLAPYRDYCSTPRNTRVVNRMCNSQDDGVPRRTGIYGYDVEVIRREEAQAPFRKLRLSLMGATAATSLGLFGLNVASLAGWGSASKLVESQSLPNAPLCGAVLGLAAYFWIEDVKVKRNSLGRINAEYQKELAGENRLERRAKRKKNRGRKGGTTWMEEEDDVSNISTPRPSGGKSGSGVWAKFAKELDDINQQSYQRALMINKDLEERGVLPPVERLPHNSTQEEEEGEQ